MKGAPGVEHLEPASDVSPLLEIEREVQARAKQASIDVGAPGGLDALRGMVESEVAAWQAAHRRGLRPYDLADPAMVVDRAVRNLTGYGPLAPLLADDDVWEIMVNSPDGASH